jgi:hypothetical protein
LLPEREVLDHFPFGWRDLSFVMPGLVPGIHALSYGDENVDGRDKPGHDRQPLRLRLSGSS